MTQHQTSTLPAPVVNRHFDIRYIEHEGQYWFTGEDIGTELGYEYPRESITKIFERNRGELEPFTVEVKLTSTDGKAYDTRVYNEEGVYIISMLARTDKARDFRVRVAGMLKALRLVKLAEAERIGAARTLARLTAIDPARLALVSKAADYRRKALTWAEVGKLMDVSRDAARKMGRQAEALGLMEVPDEN